MKKISVIILMIALSVSSCSSDNGSVEADPGETDPIEEVPSHRDTYGSFSVQMKIEDKDVVYKYWNYIPNHKEGKGYNDTYLTLSDTDYSPSEQDGLYGDFPGGKLTIKINKPEPGLYTLVNPKLYVLANGKFPIEYDKLATIELNIGINRKNYQDAIYTYTADEYIANAIEITRDENDVLHYNIKKPLALLFNGGRHSTPGNTSAPKVIKLTVDNGHYKK